MRQISFQLAASALLLLGQAAVCSAQSTLWSRHQAAVTAAQATQPRWATPLFTSSPRLEQTFRADFTRQHSATGRDAGYDTWNLGSGRGLQTILFRRTELLLSPPPFLEHTAPRTSDGFGDVSFRLKYRIFSRDEKNGNSMISATLSASLPTGKNGNGSCCAVLTPALAFGKGWGNVDVISNASGTLPVSNAPRLGHTIAWNTAVQYRLAQRGPARFFSPELESNTSFYLGGSNDGHIQSFLSPGIAIGRFPLTHTAEQLRQPTLTFGAGTQIAVTHFHTYNHAFVTSIRMRF